MLQQSLFQVQDGNFVLLCQFQQLCGQPHASQTHEQYSWMDLRVFLVQKQLWVFFKLRHLFFSTKSESLALDAQLKLFLTLDQPFLFQSHWTVFATESHRDWVTLFLLVSEDSVDGVVVSFQVKRINKLSDFVKDLIWCFVDGDLFADLFTQRLLDRGNSSKEQGDLLKFGVA